MLSLPVLMILAFGCRQRPTAEAKRQYAIERVYERGPLMARLRIDQDKVNIANTIDLELEVQIPPSFKVTMPKIDPVLNDFILADWDSLPDRLAEDGRVVKANRYRLEPIVSGTYQIPAFQFRFVDVNDPNNPYALDTEPIQVEVTSLLPEDREKLIIEDIEGVVEARGIRPVGLIVGLVITGCAVVAGLGWWILKVRSKAKASKVFRPAHELAYARLRALVNAQLIEAGKVKEFYQLLSGILRHYIEDRFQIHAPEQTSEEFLYNLSRTNTLSDQDRQELTEFLQHCDLVKFAKYSPTTQQIQRTFDIAKEFIQRTQSDVHVVEVQQTGGSHR